MAAAPEWNMPMLRRTVLLTLASCALSACSTPGTKADLLDTTLQTYAATIRWGNFEDALGFVDPETLKAHPVTTLDLERYHQIRVGGYTEQPVHESGPNEVRQVVEITVSNNNTLAVRSFIDRQTWRYDEKTKHWWLVTGLPDITQH
jgi:hypothetical protein